MPTLPAGDYEEYLIPKKGGKFRKIVAPSTELLRYQREKLRIIEADYLTKVHRTSIQHVANGFVKKRNCVTAALQHKGYQTTIMMDISTFFDDVKPHMVPEVYALDSNLWHIDQYAAQGFATSPMLANIAFIPAMLQINEYLEDYFYDFAFTIYADDIQISINTEELEALNETIQAVTSIIENQEFKINERKTRIRYAKYGYRRILGINVGENAIKATRKTMRKLRAALHQRNGPSAGGLSTWSKCYKPKS